MLLLTIIIAAISMILIPSETKTQGALTLVSVILSYAPSAAEHVYINCRRNGLQSGPNSFQCAGAIGRAYSGFAAGAIGVVEWFKRHEENGQMYTTDVINGVEYYHIDLLYYDSLRNGRINKRTND